MEKKRWTAKQKKLLVCGVFALLLGIVLCCWLGPRALELLSDGEEIRHWVQDHKLAGRMIYVCAVVAQVILAVIPGEPLEIMGGYLFGAVEGTLLCLGAAAAGSLLVFCMVRRFGERFVRLFFTHEKLRKLRFLQNSPKRLLLFLIIYMIPGTPKDLLSYYAGLTDIKLPVFLVICSLGRIPSLVTSTIGGDALGMESYLFALIVFGVALALSMGGLLLYEWICRYHDTHHDHK